MPPSRDDRADASAPRPVVLVTGGAGYIGSHACKALERDGFLPVSYDNLCTGWADAVKFGPLEQGDLLNRKRLDEVFAQHRPVAVMHFAALSQVGESMAQPGKYWLNNALGSLNLIEAATEAQCGAFVFSSTCATYGDQDGVVLDETAAQLPINAYGASKRAIEDMLANFGESHGLRSVIFRYFNVAGADPDGDIGEFHRPETHLIPLMLDAIDGRRPALTVFGSDYDTPDGTCIRDYVHVSDLVDAHVLGLRYLLEGGNSRVFNLGTGTGFSVREVVDNSRAVTNRDVPIVEGARRAGDCTRLVSGSTRAKAELGWAPRRSDMATMIADAWRWHQNGHYDR
ncbi:UDP-glucose 4-epimerase GalE [Brevirhabdus sp.]|uniref:UDP-glucose 4-epimerase GalE n=1 Tax=Brevirhabdus sp. TaxID=2004514 RepID=UPI0040583FCF